MIEERIIKDYPNYKITREGRIFNIVKGNEIHPWKDKYGYLTVNFNRKNQRVHKLLFETFFRKIQPNEIVHHLSEVKDDNRLENLVAWDRTRHVHEHHAGKPSKLKGVKITEEHRRRIAEAKKGVKRPPEVVAKILETKRLKRLLDPNYGKRRDFRRT